jgi:putative membrane protein
VEAITQEIRPFVLGLVYALTGMVLLLAGYKLFDALTPTDMQRKIFEEGNIAVAITVGLFMLGLAVVIHAGLKA